MSLLTGVGGWVLGRIKGSIAHNTAIDEGISTLLRARLIDIHIKYVEGDEPCPVDIKDEASRVYRAYHQLGGNGTGTHLYNEIMDAHVVGDDKNEL